MPQSYDLSALVSRMRVLEVVVLRVATSEHETPNTKNLNDNGLHAYMTGEALEMVSIAKCSHELPGQSLSALSAYLATALLWCGLWLVRVCGGPWWSFCAVWLCRAICARVLLVCSASRQSIAAGVIAVLLLGAA